MFQLTPEVAQSSRSQFVTLNNNDFRRGKNLKYLPYAFTEQGVAMLSSVLPLWHLAVFTYVAHGKGFVLAIIR